MYSTYKLLTISYAKSGGLTVNAGIVLTCSDESALNWICNELKKYIANPVFTWQLPNPVKKGLPFGVTIKKFRKPRSIFFLVND